MGAASAVLALLSQIAIATGSRAASASHLDTAMAANSFFAVVGCSRINAIYLLFRYVIVAATVGIFALTSGAPADSAGLSEKSSWLLGDFTQNAPCKGDGSDLAELKVRIAADQIESKSGVCNFLAVTLEGKRLKANMECHFPAGPLIGDVTFTPKANGTIDVVDRDNNYTAILYRCPK